MDKYTTKSGDESFEISGIMSKHMYVFNHWKIYVLVNKYIKVVHITSYRFDTRNVCLITRKLQRQP